MPEDKKQAQIVIDGREYPFPEFDTLTMDEADTLYRYAKVTLDKLAELDGFHPGVIMGMVHIAIARVRADLKATEIEARIRTLKMDEMAAALGSLQGDDADPPPSGTGDEPAPSGEISDATMAAIPANGQPLSIGSLGSGIG